MPLTRACPMGDDKFQPCGADGKATALRRDMHVVRKTLEIRRGQWHEGNITSMDEGADPPAKMDIVANLHGVQICSGDVRMTTEVCKPSMEKGMGLREQPWRPMSVG